MKCRPLSVRRLFYVNCIGLLFSMAMITLIAFSFTLEGAVLIMGPQRPFALLYGSSY